MSPYYIGANVFEIVDSKDVNKTWDDSIVFNVTVSVAKNFTGDLDMIVLELKKSIDSTNKSVGDTSLYVDEIPRPAGY